MITWENTIGKVLQFPWGRFERFSFHFLANHAQVPDVDALDLQIKQILIKPFQKIFF